MIIKLRAYIAFVSAVMVCFILAGCQQTAKTQSDKSSNRHNDSDHFVSTDVIYVTMQTTLGEIDIELYRDRAPVTVNNFLRYIDSGQFNGGSFYRVVTADNDNGSPKITVIQADVADSNKQFAPIAHESTQDTGILHLDGTLSMARLEPYTATSAFFICIGPQPALDFAGKRNPDLQGFAAFGRVINGMDVVRKINQIRETKSDVDPYLAGQMLKEPVTIIRFRRQ